MRPPLNELDSTLASCALINNSAYSRGWGKQGYSIKEGYNSEMQNLPFPSASKMWKHVWNSDGLPKVNIFNWILVHARPLATSNCISEDYKVLQYVNYAKQLWKLAIIIL